MTKKDSSLLPHSKIPHETRKLPVNSGRLQIGRPVAFALAAEGEAGVRKVLQTLRDEFELTMASSGCTSPREITRSHIVTEADSHLLACLEVMMLLR